MASWLARMSLDGHHVFHDVVAAGFNIDHVVIGPRGIYCIETKTSSRPASESAVYDGNVIRIGDGPFTDAPLRQVEANARWLGKRLENLTGRVFMIKTAVLYPDRQAEMPKGRSWKGMHWVLSPGAFITTVKKEYDGLPPADVRLVAEMLDTMTRSVEVKPLDVQ